MHVVVVGISVFGVSCLHLHQERLHGRRGDLVFVEASVAGEEVVAEKAKGGAFASLSQGERVEGPRVGQLKK